jgi:hypothetical protein
MTKYKAHNWHSFGRLDSRNLYASLQTSLGCPFKCTFCCINAPFERNTIRFWSPKHIAKQIKFLVEEYNILNIKIPDEMFVLNPKQVIGVCDEIIKLGYGDKLNFWAYARIDTLEDDEMLKKMQKAGIRWLGLGIESSSKHVRDGVIKGRFDNYDIEGIVKKVRKMGFFVLLTALIKFMSFISGEAILYALQSKFSKNFIDVSSKTDANQLIFFLFKIFVNFSIQFHGVCAWPYKSNKFKCIDQGLFLGILKSFLLLLIVIVSGL